MRFTATSFRGCHCNIHRGVIVLAVLFIVGSAAWAQDPNACDEPGDFPDVIVGDLHQIGNYGPVGDLYGYSVGTVSCNIGTCWLDWISSTPAHPVIAQNLYRLKDGRFTHVGQSWLKHGFFALSQDLCSPSCIGTSGSHLGVNCSDPYSAGLNGSQGGLGPRFEVNASTGEFPFPHAYDDITGDAIYKRIQVHRDDLDPALNVGARYFVEGQYIAADDAEAGRDNNNSSFREVTVNPTTYDLSLIGETKPTQSGIEAWRTFGTDIKLADYSFPNDGRFLIASSPIDLGDGFHRYEIAIYNQNSHVSARSLSVPVAAGSTVRNIGFHDVDYHSGEPYDPTDWAFTHDTLNNRVLWEADSYADNPDANALRWGTVYTFWFESDAVPVDAQVGLEPFRPGAGDIVTSGSVRVPEACNNNGTCDPGEDCSNCLNDCINDLPPSGFCGDNVCEAALGENCTNCDDCAGVSNGNPANRWCCGDGGGTNPIGCNDPRCTTAELSCGTTAAMTCCGDGICETPEDICSCSADCGMPPQTEATCDDGIDNDCDGQTDCGDVDCCNEASCFTGIDGDGDGIADCDCDDTNDQVWGTPGEAAGLTLEQDSVIGTMLDWVSPAQQGGLALTYETVRTDNPQDFAVFSSCVADADPSDTTNVDTDDPAPGVLFSYLVRAVNTCPNGRGTLGVDSGFVERLASVCP